jgi:hypothetical protein
MAPTNGAAATVVETSTATTATTTTAVSTTITTISTAHSSSLRYERLVSVLEKALKQSRQHFNVKQAVAQVYGDDANIFGCSSSSSNKNKTSSSSSSKRKAGKDDSSSSEDNDDQTSNNMLRQVFESMLDHIEEAVSEYMLQDYLVQSDMQEKFCKLERIVELLRLQDIERQQMEEADKQSARRAVEAAKRPPAAGTTNDVIYWTTLHEMQAQRDALQLQVESIEAENRQLHEEQARRLQTHTKSSNNKGSTSSALQVVQQLAMELEDSADVGSIFVK